MSTLFSPFSCKSLTLKNRIVMAPMTRYFSPNGVAGEDVAAYYRRRAEGEVGLIVTEGTTVGRSAASNNPAIPRFHGEDALAGWRNVAQVVHGAGGRIAPQLWHVGSAPDTIQGTPSSPDVESPSGIFDPATRLGRTMTEQDIADTIEAFARAAKDAQDLGFDCIELHAAHGYLFDQFFWPVTNLRDDRFGGDWEGRTVFTREVLRAIRREVGPDFVVIIRISQWKQQDYGARIAETPTELEKWLAPLAEAGVDIFHCSQRRFWEPEFGGSSLNLAGWAKKVTGCPTITVGSVGLNGEFMESLTSGEINEPASLDGLLERLDQGEFDLVAVGRAILSDPHWVRKIREGRTDELRPFQRTDLERLY